MKSLQTAYQELRRSRHAHGPIDGITIFMEDDIVFTAQLARDLNLPYHPVEVARTTRNKAKTRKALKAAGLKVPNFFLIQNPHTLDGALSQLTRLYHATGVSSFPMLLKPVFGAGSVFTVKVNDAEETRDVYGRMSQEISNARITISKEDVDFIFEEFISGSEWDVDAVLQGGRIKYVSIFDNWSLQEPSFLSPCDSLPSLRLTPEAQNASIQLAINAAIALGFTDGVLHIEGKYDSIKGPQILEINGRSGGAYQVPWNLDVWGVDLVEMLYATALQIPISVYKAEFPRTHLEGE